MSTINIKDKATRDSIQKIEKRLKAIENLPQLSSDSTNKQIIDIINQITKSLKRR